MKQLGGSFFFNFSPSSIINDETDEDATTRTTHNRSLQMRKLYERSHADNHVDERSFLASLRTNLGVVAFEFWPCVRSAFEVVHQMSSVSVLLVAGDHLARSEMETNHLAVFISMLLLLGGLLRTRMLLRERAGDGRNEHRGEHGEHGGEDEAGDGASAGGETQPQPRQDDEDQRGDDVEAKDVRARIEPRAEQHREQDRGV